MSNNNHTPTSRVTLTADEAHLLELMTDYWYHTRDTAEERTDATFQSLYHKVTEANERVRKAELKAEFGGQAQ